MIKHWIEAMRLRTLPVSLAGVVMAWGFNFINHNFNLTPAILCLLFALLAQISSNFANEYYDFKWCYMEGKWAYDEEWEKRVEEDIEINGKGKIIENMIYHDLIEH